MGARLGNINVDVLSSSAVRDTCGVIKLDL